MWPLPGSLLEIDEVGVDAPKDGVVPETVQTSWWNGSMAENSIRACAQQPSKVIAPPTSNQLTPSSDACTLKMTEGLVPETLPTETRTEPRWSDASGSIGRREGAAAPAGRNGGVLMDGIVDVYG